MRMPKGITEHHAVQECNSGESGGSDYRYEVWLRSGFVFANGRMAGCRGAHFNNVAEFNYASPVPAMTGGKE